MSKTASGFPGIWIAATRENVAVSFELNSWSRRASSPGSAAVAELVAMPMVRHEAATLDSIDRQCARVLDIRRSPVFSLLLFSFRFVVSAGTARARSKPCSRFQTPLPCSAAAGSIDEAATG
jgi:hypothetical protein